jgi:Domain of unknown function (DUF4173)
MTGVASMADTIGTAAAPTVTDEGSGSRPNMPFAVGASFALVILADVLFYERMAGWTLGLFAASVVLSMTLCHRDVLRSNIGRIIIVFLLGLAMALVETTSGLAITLFCAGLVSLGLATQPVVFTSPRRWLGAHIDYLFAAASDPFRDLKKLMNAGIDAWSSEWIERVSLAWLLPLVGAAIFLSLFASANPILDSWLKFPDLGHFRPALPEPFRAFLWVATGVPAWMLLRTRISDPNAGIASDAFSSPDRNRFVEKVLPLAAVLRAMVLFNLLFALQNGLDLTYLWANVALPQGFTYAGYAHRSAYPLMLSVLIAAAFTLIAFRPGSDAESSRALKLGMFVWIGQNLLLVVSAARRTVLYVEVYSLTYWRVAALVWMGLVAIGLVLLVFRFATDRTNQWLLNANLMALLSVLYALCFYDVGRAIAEFNVSHSKEISGAGQRLDVGYLHSIGPSALPALYRYVRDGKISQQSEREREQPYASSHQNVPRTDVFSVITQIERDLASRSSDWYATTWRLHRTARESGLVRRSQ